MLHYNTLPINHYMLVNVPHIIAKIALKPNKNASPLPQSLNKIAKITSASKRLMEHTSNPPRV